MTKAMTTSDGRPAAAAALLLALAAAFAPGAGAGPSTASAIDVVGSGTLAWKKVAVHAQPTRDSKVVAVLREFRQDFSPQYVLALSHVRDPRTEKPTWYRISVPGLPEREDRLGSGGIGRAQAGAQAPLR